MTAPCAKADSPGKDTGFATALLGSARRGVLRGRPRFEAAAGDVVEWGGAADFDVNHELAISRAADAADSKLS